MITPTSKRAFGVSFAMAIALGFASGCFALFSLDGYGPPADAEDAGGDVIEIDASMVVRVDSAPPDVFVPGRKIFVTGESFTGALGGRDGGDDKCQTAANDAGLGGRYVAWLSDQSSDAPDRLLSDAGPLRLINGTLVANSLSDLETGGPRVPITLDEHGKALGGGGCDDGGLTAWSATYLDGGGAETRKGGPGGGATCFDWTEATTVGGQAGVIGASGFAWTSGCVRECNATSALYCIEH